MKRRLPIVVVAVLIAACGGTGTEPCRLYLSAEQTLRSKDTAECDRVTFGAVTDNCIADSTTCSTDDVSALRTHLDCIERLSVCAAASQDEFITAFNACRRCTATATGQRCDVPVSAPCLAALRNEESS